MALVSEVLEHIGRICNPLNLANMLRQKLKFVLNTAPDKQRVLNLNAQPLLAQPLLAHVLVRIC